MSVSRHADDSKLRVYKPTVWRSGIYVDLGHEMFQDRGKVF